MEGMFSNTQAAMRPLHKKPVPFITMNSTEDAEDVADWLAKVRVGRDSCFLAKQSRP